MKKVLCLFLSLLMIISVFSVTSAAVDVVAFKEVVCTFDGIELSWASVKDAANYILYRADGEDGAGIVIATTTGTEYFDDDVEIGEIYTYKIVVQGKDGSYTDIDFADFKGLRLEAREKLNKVRPVNVGQASRIPGVSPSDISALLLELKARGI